MRREKLYFTDELPGQGRRPPLQVTLHAEDDALVLALAAVPGHAAPKHPPGPATVASLVTMVAAEVGECSLDVWAPYDEFDGSIAGWSTTVRGRGVRRIANALSAS